MTTADYVGKVVDQYLRSDGVRQATKYVSPTCTIKVTRKLYGGKIYKRSRSIDLVVTIGKPNYREKEFIRQCQKAGEQFPLKNIQLKFVK